MTWDQLRADTKGKTGPAPRCSRCRRRSVLNPCRACATPAELNETWEARSRGKPLTVPKYPELTPVTLCCVLRGDEEPPRSDFPVDVAIAVIGPIGKPL